MFHSCKPLVVDVRKIILTFPLLLHTIFCFQINQIMSSDKTQSKIENRMLELRD